MDQQRTLFVGAVIAALFAPAGPALGADDDKTAGPSRLEASTTSELDYLVQPGDTLRSITERYLKRGLDWRDLGAVNRTTRSNSIRTGQTIRIPVSWIRSTQIAATIASVSGQAKVNGEPATRATAVRESDNIKTGPDGVVVVRLPDGTKMSIAPSSQVRVDRLRRYFGGDAVNARMRLEKGQIDTNSPPQSATSKENPNSKRDIRIQTPKATAAVRGTQFRVADSSDRSASGVLTGAVTWSAPAGQLNLPAGFGSSADATGRVTEPEALLAAPALTVPTEPLQETVFSIPFSPVAGAVAYKVRVAANSQFSNDLSEQIVSDTSFQVSSKRDGNHFVSIRAISANGIEGKDGIGKLTFVARPFAPVFETPANESLFFQDDLLLRWQTSDQASAYRVQVATDPQFRDVKLDTKVRGQQVNYKLAREAAGAVVRYWRVASMDGWTLGPFSDARQFTLRQSAPRPSARPAREKVTLSWPAAPDASGYILTLSPAERGTSPTKVISSRRTEITVDELWPGKYVATVTNVFGDLRSPPGPAQPFTVPKVVLDSTNQPVFVGEDPVIVTP